MNTLPVRAEALFFIRYKMLLPLQGVNAMIIRVTQGVASLALGYALLGFQPVHIVAEYDGKIASKSCRKKCEFRTPYQTGLGWRVKP